MSGPPDIAFDMVDDMSSDPVLTVFVATPAGTLKIMAEAEKRGSTLLLHGLHMQDLEADRIGAANLMAIAGAAMERMELDGLVIAGGLRTTGANPGPGPRVIRFARRIRPASAP